MKQEKQKQKIGADLLGLEEGENQNQNQNKMRRKVGKYGRAAIGLYRGVEAFLGLGYISVLGQCSLFVFSLKKMS